MAVIQESKLTPKSKNPGIQNYTTFRKDHPHGQGGVLLIFIHRSVNFSKQPSSAELLYHPHLEELAIEVEIGNTKLIISNIYIPTASSCSNGYPSSIEHLLTTKDSIILGDFNANHPSWYSGSTNTRGRKMADSITGSDHGILNWDTPTRVPPNVEQVRQMSLCQALAGRYILGTTERNLLMTYKAVGRSIINYAAPVWSTNLHDTNYRNIQYTQNEALRISTGCHKMSSVDHLHAESKHAESKGTLRATIRTSFC